MYQNRINHLITEKIKESGAPKNVQDFVLELINLEQDILDQLRPHWKEKYYSLLSKFSSRKE